MAETARFFDSVSYDEAAQADFNLKMLRPEGVFQESALGTLAVTATNGNMTVTVTPGEAHVRGFQYINSSNKTLTIAANTSGSTRIDVVVLRLDRAANSLFAVVLQGTPGSGTPALTQTALGIWEFPLAYITVANAAASIVAGNVSDQRAYSKWLLASLEVGNLPLIKKSAIIFSDGTISAQKGGITCTHTINSGIYTLTLTPAMSNNTYTVIAMAGIGYTIGAINISSSSVQIQIQNIAGAAADTVFRVIVIE